MSEILQNFAAKQNSRGEGLSDTLKSLFSTIFEATCEDGSLRHNDRMQQNLINTIASHSYSKIIFIHCHFLAFAAQKSIPLYEWFVTPRQMTGHLLLQMFKKQSVINEELPKLTQKEGTILHASFGEYKFDINLNFVATNFALLDLLLEVIGYNLFEKKI